MGGAAGYCNESAAQQTQHQPERFDAEHPEPEHPEPERPEPEHPEPERLEPEPFFSILSGGAVLLFALNNFVLKDAYNNALTGKLSDFAACFFLPLYLGALLKWVVERPVAWRLRWGAAATTLGFAAVKTVPLASAALNELVAGLTRWTGLLLRPNQVDPTDLIALVMVPLALAYARSRSRIPHERPALG